MHGNLMCCVEHVELSAQSAAPLQQIPASTARERRQTGVPGTVKCLETCTLLAAIQAQWPWCPTVLRATAAAFQLKRHGFRLLCSLCAHPPLQALPLVAAVATRGLVGAPCTAAREAADCMVSLRQSLRCCCDGVIGLSRKLVNHDPICSSLAGSMQQEAPSEFALLHNRVDLQRVHV